MTKRVRLACVATNGCTGTDLLEISICDREAFRPNAMTRLCGRSSDTFGFFSLTVSADGVHLRGDTERSRHAVRTGLQRRTPRRRHHQEKRLLLLLPQELSRRRPAGRRARRRLHLRRVHRPLPVDPRTGATPPRHQQAAVQQDSHAAADRRPARPVRHRPGARQEGAGRGRPQPLQAADARHDRLGRRDRQVEHPLDRPDRLGQDAAWPKRWPGSSTCPSPSATPPR